MTEQHIPESLQASPKGWKQRMNIHLNYGSDGGAAIYTVIDPEGRETPILYQYDTRKPQPAVAAKGKRKAREAFEPPKTGFHVPKVDSDVMSWKELHEAWPDILAKLRGETPAEPAKAPDPDWPFPALKATT